jgi:hypothetical protein
MHVDGTARVVIDILLTNNSSMSLLPVNMNCIQLISMIWFVEVTVCIIFVCSSSKRHKGKRQRLGSSVESIYVLCEACI